MTFATNVKALSGAGASGRCSPFGKILAVKARNTGPINGEKHGTHGYKWGYNSLNEAIN